MRVSSHSVPRAGRVLWTVAMAGVLAFANSGCNYFILLGYLIGGPPMSDPDFVTMTGKDFSDKDVTVAVVCFAPNEVKWDFDEIDMELARYVSHRLHQNKIKVIQPDRVRVWLDKNPEWDRAEEIGAAMKCKYVVYVDMHDYGLYEQNSTQLYRGRCEGWVSVFEMDDDGHGEKIYSKEMNSRYPLSVPRSTSETNYQTFKREYLSRLSDEIGRLFYSVENGHDITDVM